MVNTHYSDLGMDALRIANAENQTLRAVLRTILRRTGPIEIMVPDVGLERIVTEQKEPGVIAIRLECQREHYGR